MESVGISRVLGRTHSGNPFTHKRRKGELKICAGYKGSRVLDRYMNKHEHEVHHSEPRWTTERVEAGQSGPWPMCERWRPFCAPGQLKANFTPWRAVDSVQPHSNNNNKVP